MSEDHPATAPQARPGKASRDEVLRHLPLAILLATVVLGWIAGLERSSVRWSDKVPLAVASGLGSIWLTLLFALLLANRRRWRAILRPHLSKLLAVLTLLVFIPVNNFGLFPVSYGFALLSSNIDLPITGPAFTILVPVYVWIAAGTLMSCVAVPGKRGLGFVLMYAGTLGLTVVAFGIGRI